MLLTATVKHFSTYLSKTVFLQGCVWILIALFFYIVLSGSRYSHDNYSHHYGNINNDIGTYSGYELPQPPPVLFKFECDPEPAEKKIKTRNPVIVWGSEDSNPLTSTYECNDFVCDYFTYQDRHKPAEVKVYVFYGSNTSFSKLPLPRHPHKILWAIYHDESPRNAQELMHEKALSLFNFSSTYSRYSDFPFPLYNIIDLEAIRSQAFFVETRVKNSLLNEIAPIAYIQSNCKTSTERDAYVIKLMEYIPIDSYGDCVNNKPLSSDLTKNHLSQLYGTQFLRFIARYKFMIGIENGVCDDYVTEKFWRPIHVGVVPIYFGSPLIRDWLPNEKSAILLLDYPTPKLLSEYVKTLLSNDTLYEEYLEHKIKRIIANQRLAYELKVRPYQTTHDRFSEFLCFMCKKAHHLKNNTEINIVTKAHLNCPKPVTALTFGVNPFDEWSQQYDFIKREVDHMYDKLMNISTTLYT